MLLPDMLRLFAVFINSVAVVLPIPISESVVTEMIPAVTVARMPIVIVTVIALTPIGVSPIVIRIIIYAVYNNDIIGISVAVRCIVLTVSILVVNCIPCSAEYVSDINKSVSQGVGIRNILSHPNAVYKYGIIISRIPKLIIVRTCIELKIVTLRGNANGKSNKNESKNNQFFHSVSPF